ncbi:transcription repressor OFP12-like [Lotus japonicus]|uniref:transcription repressor OFP12-like n=1 Tax=Lotus japonicus TaxID=34305 RepID=UPI002587B944|nr:transcription repressor OFP12-like [Lotus japonicus]
MPSMFSKHLHLCFFKIKYPTFLSQPDPHHHHHHTPSPPSTLNSTTFHFNSTFTHHSHSLYDSTTDNYFTSSSSSSSDSMDLPPPDFASIYASQRFFFSSPGSSNSITESTPDSRPCNTLIRRDVVSVQKYSVNPFVDFLCSMQEMIDSHKVLDVNSDWDYLHQLLLCYLALNPPHTHKHIVRAFTHLVVDLLSSSSSSSSSSNTPCRMHNHNHQRQGCFSGRLV